MRATLATLKMWSRVVAAAALAMLLGCGDDSGTPPVDAGRVDSAAADAGPDARTGTADAAVDAAVGPMCTADHGGHLALINAATTSDSVAHDPTLALLPASGVLPPPQ